MCHETTANTALFATVLFLSFSGIVVGPVPADDQDNSSPALGLNEQHAATRLVHTYCSSCHGADEPEGNIRLDTFDLGGTEPRSGATLQKILRVVKGKKMPPPEAEAPSDHERAKMVAWVQDRLDRLAIEVRRSRKWSRSRRLTAEEYEYTMQDLFAVDAEFADLLPADPIAATGYRNDAERLGLSSLQIESYLDSARRAVGRYLQFHEFDEPALRYHIELEDLYYSTASRYETRKRAPRPLDHETFLARRASNAASKPKYVDPLGPMLPGAFSDDEAMRAAIPKLNQQYIAIPERLPVGELIVRVRAAGTASRDERFPRMRVEAGITLGDGCSMNKRLLGEVDVTAPLDMPATYLFHMRLENVPTKGPLKDEESFDQLSVFDMDQLFISNVSHDSRAIFSLGRGGYTDPVTGSTRIAGPLSQMSEAGCNFLNLDCVEIEVLPGLGSKGGPYRWKVPGADNLSGHQGEVDRIREFLSQFMRQAYRRPINADEVATKLELFTQLREKEFSFEESLRETLAAVLISPSFLFLALNPGAGESQPLDGMASHSLAIRLSYLLWLSPPDEQLIKRADDGSIVKVNVLRSEAERLLADPRSRRFLENFCQQWLRMDKYDNIRVDRGAYPTYDRDFAEMCIQETRAFFVEVFASNASALDLIESKYAILNDRLAEHYGVERVVQGGLHKVALPESSVNGGLLTHASLLTMNSDGIDSHPIRRGVWLLERILNSQPPPPPPNVPEIDKADPEFQGLSLKDRIALHRRPGVCRSCHRSIDPWGIPFEEFDATGRWRDKVILRSGGKLEVRPVDAQTRLPDGQQIQGIVELKKYLRQHRAQQFADSLVYHMLTYVMGRPPDFADDPHVAEIQRRFTESQYRLRDLVLAIVESPLFRN